MSKKNYFIQNCTDSLNHYLKQIECHHPLTQEEEQELGRRILSGDTAARDELIEANLRFVLKCALEMQTPYVPIDELIAAGNYGLTIAATRFDPSYATRFCTYAVHYICNSIREAIREWTCQVSTSDPLQGLQACLSLDERHDEDEENWSRDLIDRIPAPPMSSDEHRLAEEAK
jgi:RNA polymerase primary sigma factor